MKKWSIVEYTSIIIMGIVGVIWIPFGMIGFYTLATVDLLAIIPVTVVSYVVQMYAEYKYLEARKEEGRP